MSCVRGKLRFQIIDSKLSIVDLKTIFTQKSTLLGTNLHLLLLRIDLAKLHINERIKIPMRPSPLTSLMVLVTTSVGVLVLAMNKKRDCPTIW